MNPRFPPCLEPPVDGQPWAPPLDALDAAVRLETAGVTDEVAQREYDAGGTLQLAERCLPWARLFPATSPDCAPRVSLLRECLHGTAFAVPLIMCSLSLLLFRMSLWGGKVSAELAAAVGVGTVSSFVCTGALIHGMARRCLFFLSVEEPASARRACIGWTLASALSLAITGLLLLLCSAYFEWLSFPLSVTAVAFHFALGMFWVAAGILHMLERFRYTALATALGIAIVMVAHAQAGVSITVAQLAGISVAAAVAFAAGFRILHRFQRGRAGTPRRFSAAEELYRVWPYALFGALYFVLVFGDRVLAWTVPDFAAPGSIQFRGDYETAIDLALIAFILQYGSVRSGVTAFFRDLADAGKRYRVTERAAFRRTMTRTYHSRVPIFALLVMLSSGLVYAGASRMGLLADPRVHRIFLAALPGFSLLVFSLWNTSLLFRLSRPLDSLNALTAGTAVAIGSGYVLTRVWGYPLASTGFTLGAACLAILSTRRMMECLGTLDYNYFVSAS